MVSLPNTTIILTQAGIPDLTGQLIKDDDCPVIEGTVWAVCRYRWQLPPEYPPVALKVTRFYLRETTDRVKQEIKVWARLQHQHILPLVGFVLDHGPMPGLVSPWMANGNLIQFLTAHYGRLDRCERFLLLQDITSALQYLHGIPVIHGNINGSNILVDERQRALITDVGVSIVLGELTEAEIGKAATSTIRYTAPEILDYQEHNNRLPTPKSDIWSFGCNMIHVLSGKKPWGDEVPKMDIIRHVLRQHHVPTLPHEISEQEPRVVSFLGECFSFRPADRPSADQVLAFVQGELSCMNPTPWSVETTVHTPHHGGIPEVMSEFWRRVFDQMPSYLIYIPEMRLVSRDDLADILEPEMTTEEDIFRWRGWSRQSTIESKVVPDLLKYAILSHRWGQSEPTFQDLKSGKCEGAGYEKLHEFCQRARQYYDCDFAWSDTCCINKESSSELDEAIRSMYRWYRDAYICIVCLARSQSLDTLYGDEWFDRAWTLQELLAPSRMKFYGSNWTPLTNNENDKEDPSFITALNKVTNIPLNDLYNFRPGPNRAWEKMTWATHRKATRIEDIAYSLTGIFDISITIAYGEGDRAFKRFMAELMQNCKEWQILVWAGGLPGSPTKPACYCTSDEWALTVLKQHQVSWWGEGSGDSYFSVTKRGVKVKLLVVPVLGDENFDKWTFIPWPSAADQYDSEEPALSESPLEELIVPLHYFPPASTTEWAIAIVNYHHYVPDRGKLKRGERYICFLLRRLRRLGRNVAQDHWRREVTKNILTVSCANDFEDTLETIWL